MIYALLSDAGVPRAFFPTSVFPDVDGSRNPDIPAEAVVITDDAWHEFLAFPNMRRWNGAAAEPCPPVSMVPAP